MVTGLLSILAGALLALLCLVLSLTVGVAYFALVAVAVFWTLFWIRTLRSAWPAGIWVDATGIRIGDARALPFATGESYSVFTCAWPAVREITVSERGGLRSHLPRSPGPAGADLPKGRSTWLRRLPAPFTRAVLIIDVDLETAGAPRHLVLSSIYGLYAVGNPPRLWLAPTRHPRQLRAALGLVRGHSPAAGGLSP
jgi:hypothetical protein